MCAGLLTAASLTANSFYRVDVVAGKLMWPYIAWLVLANALNLSIASQNPDVSCILGELHIIASTDFISYLPSLQNAAWSKC